MDEDHVTYDRLLQTVTEFNIGQSSLYELQQVLWEYQTDLRHPSSWPGRLPAADNILNDPANMLEKDEIDAIKEMALDLKLSETLCLKCWTLAKNPEKCRELEQKQEVKPGTFFDEDERNRFTPFNRHDPHRKEPTAAREFFYAHRLLLLEGLFDLLVGLHLGHGKNLPDDRYHMLFEEVSALLKSPTSTQAPDQGLAMNLMTDVKLIGDNLDELQAQAPSPGLHHLSPRDRRKKQFLEEARLKSCECLFYIYYNMQIEFEEAKKMVEIIRDVSIREKDGKAKLSMNDKEVLHVLMLALACSFAPKPPLDRHTNAASLAAYSAMPNKLITNPQKTTLEDLIQNVDNWAGKPDLTQSGEGRSPHEARYGWSCTQGVVALSWGLMHSKQSAMGSADAVTKKFCNKAIEGHAFSFLATTFLAAGGSYEASRKNVTRVYLEVVFDLLTMYFDFCKEIEKDQEASNLPDTGEEARLRDHFRTSKQLQHYRNSLIETDKVTDASYDFPDSLKEVVHLAQQLCQRDRTICVAMFRYFDESQMWVLKKLGEISNPDKDVPAPDKEVFFFLFTFVPFMTTLAEGPHNCADQVHTFFESDKANVAHQIGFPKQQATHGTWWQWFFVAVKGFVERNCHSSGHPHQTEYTGDNKLMKRMVLAELKPDEAFERWQDQQGRHIEHHVHGGQHHLLGNAHQMRSQQGQAQHIFTAAYQRVQDEVGVELILQLMCATFRKAEPRALKEKDFCEDDLFKIFIHDQPMALKGAVLQTLAVFARPVMHPNSKPSRQKAERIWHMLYSSRALTGITVELENREASDREYPGTVGFCTLLRELLMAGVGPITLDYIKHVRDNVIQKIDRREYLEGRRAERWQVAATALSIFDQALLQYQPVVDGGHSVTRKDVSETPSYFAMQSIFEERGQFLKSILNFLQCEDGVNGLEAEWERSTAIPDELSNIEEQPGCSAGHLLGTDYEMELRKVGYWRERAVFFCFRILETAAAKQAAFHKECAQYTPEIKVTALVPGAGVWGAKSCMLLQDRRARELVELIKYVQYRLSSEISMMSVRLMLRLSLASDELGPELAKLMSHDRGGGRVIRAFTSRLLTPFKEDHQENDSITSGTPNWVNESNGNGGFGGLVTSTSWAEMDGHGDMDKRHNFVRWLVLQMIIENLAQSKDAPRPSFGHLLLGFPVDGPRVYLEWAKDSFSLTNHDLHGLATGATSSTQPDNCLHAVLHIMREPDVYLNKPHQAEACLWLLHSLCENRYTSAATLKLIRRRSNDPEDFCCAQLHKVLESTRHVAEQAAATNQGEGMDGALLLGGADGGALMLGGGAGGGYGGGEVLTAAELSVQRAATLARTNAYAWLLKIIAIELRVTSSSSPPQPQHTFKLLGALFNSDARQGLVPKQPLEGSLFAGRRPQSAVLNLLDLMATQANQPPGAPSYFTQVEQHALHWLETREYVWGEYRCINVQGLHESLYADGKHSQQQQSMIAEGLSWATHWNHHQKQVAVEAHVVGAWQQVVRMGLDAFKTVTDLQQVRTNRLDQTD
jgi:hypothetical protein